MVKVAGSLLSAALMILAGAIASVVALRGIVFGNWGDVLLGGLVAVAVWGSFIAGYRGYKEQQRRLAKLRRRVEKAAAKNAKKEDRIQRKRTQSAAGS